ncbi:gentisate 1,2-dioxygenase [Mycobacteroides abscessus subsp. abscessus]|nr:gentisate 1,2-dioxygenase [Mycobacteroides abscessus subsp. abscessus]
MVEGLLGLEPRGSSSCSRAARGHSVARSTYEPLTRRSVEARCRCAAPRSTRLLRADSGAQNHVFGSVGQVGRFSHGPQRLPRPVAGCGGTGPARCDTRARAALPGFREAATGAALDGDVGRGGERRAITLANPGLDGRPFATPTLWAAIQYLMPGEDAPEHRHIQHASCPRPAGTGTRTTTPPTNRWRGSTGSTSRSSM